MKKLYLALALLALIGIASAMDEYKAGDNITIRSMYADNGVPTDEATCVLNLYSQTDKVINNAPMYDTGDGWYNYTIMGWLTTDNRTVYDGYVYCTKDGVSGSTSFSFLLVRETTDQWLYEANDTLGDIEQIVNETLDVTNQINDTLGNIANTTERILNATESGNTAQISFFDTMTNLFYVMSQKVTSMLEYDMRATAHYRLLASKNLNCTFDRNDIVLDRYTVSNVFSTEGVLDNGAYCFKVTGYDPVSDTYGMWSDPKIYIVNNTG